MAKMINPQSLTLNTCTSLIFPSIHAPKSLFPSQSLAISTKPISKIRYTRSLIGPSFVAKASTAAAVPDNITDVLGDVGIFTATGEPVKFEDLWDQKEGMAVVALLRHFGCFCCWELAEALKESKERFDSAGVKLIAVGVGTPNKARLLAERAKVFSRMEAVKKAMKNYTIEATPDDRSGVLQQGGMFVFKGNQLLYARKDEGTGDHAPLDDIFDICCKASTV
ncbi:prostamide/prostaglandin F synthase isoform X2 [Olea europaea var. sylvestris]|uniref:prostamide/prostaglandin F synthase isoform X2 n=1 Tax=Olea europaea var. sylvestris TaxID=158386 RepID=UPI000C1D6370|nr:prostamide/prostaglandin F synthase isoform X2 [Olea europaea var. sylvestris]